MKTLRMITALMLCTVMLLSVNSCQNADQEKLIGTWEAEFDISEYINKATDENISEYAYCFEVEDLPLVLRITYNADGTYKMSVDKAKFREACDSLLPDFTEGVEKMYAETSKNMGIPVDELLSIAGMTYEEIAAKMISNMDTEAMAAELQKEGKFKLSNGKLFRSNSVDEKIDKKKHETYEFIDNGTLTISGYVGDDADSNPFKYPMEFKKVD